MLFLLRTLKWSDVTVWVKILGDNGLAQGHIWLDIMGRAYLTVWGGVGGGAEGNKYSMCLLSSPCIFSSLSSVVSMLSRGPLRYIFLYISDYLMVCTYWKSICAVHAGSCICTVCLPFFLCAHGCYAFGSAWEQPALNNIILCQQALQVMYVLLPSGELRAGWNEGRMRILWCPFDGIFITYLWH